MSTRPAERVEIILCRLTKTKGGSCKFVLSRPHVPKVRFGSWSCKNTLPKEVGEKPGPVRSQATIAAISGLVPTMFMTRVRL
jgi:hypothetical protein